VKSTCLVCAKWQAHITIIPYLTAFNYKPLSFFNSPQFPAPDLFARQPMQGIHHYYAFILEKTARDADSWSELNGENVKGINCHDKDIFLHSYFI